MITVSVLSILLSLSAPSYSEFINKRKVAGVTDQISTFFENVKMEAVTRNDFVTITYKKTGNNWCFGARTGQHAKCDCLATEPSESNACQIDLSPGGQAVILSNTSFEGLAGLQTSTELEDDDHLDFNPVRGSVSHFEKVTMQIGHNSEDYQVNLSVTPTGRVVKCTPSDYQSAGYPTCI